jgi:hypothetical protein
VPVHSSNVFDEAHSFYEAMIRDLIEDIPLPDGRFRPRLKFNELVERVIQKAKPAQVLVQVLAESRGTAEELKTAALHGSWVMAALIAGFGADDPSIQMVRGMAPESYEKAMELLSHVT